MPFCTFKVNFFYSRSNYIRYLGNYFLSVATVFENLMHLFCALTASLSDLLIIHTVDPVYSERGYSEYLLIVNGFLRTDR